MKGSIPDLKSPQKVSCYPYPNIPQGSSHHTLGSNYPMGARMPMWGSDQHPGSPTHSGNPVMSPPGMHQQQRSTQLSQVGCIQTIFMIFFEGLNDHLCVTIKEAQYFKVSQGYVQNFACMYSHFHAAARII